MPGVKSPIEENDLLLMVLDPEIKLTWVCFNRATGFTNLIMLSYDDHKSRFDMVMSTEEGPIARFFDKTQAHDACVMFNDFMKANS